jgi:hypothetical protein
MKIKFAKKLEELKKPVVDHSEKAKKILARQKIDFDTRVEATIKRKLLQK